MRVSCIQCDVCCKSHKIEDEYDAANLPFGWFTVIPGQGGGFKENMHFCSIDCLRDYAVKEVNPIRFHELGLDFSKLPDPSELTPVEIDRHATPEHWRDL